MATPLTLFDEDELDPEPAEPLVRVRLTVAYDGTPFHGFALNPGVPTVAGRLTEALERVLRHPVELACAGRTDKGVHAHGQVVDLTTAEGVDLVALCRALNALCGPEVAVRDPQVVPMGWSSRFDATARRYRYTIHNDEVPDPFSVHTAWHVREPLGLDVLRLACDPLIGTHDFTSFCRRPKRSDGGEVSLVRDVRSARWERVDEHTLRFWIEASSFCHQMVRSIVGTLVEVGLGRMPAGDIRAIIAARDRRYAGPVAPPHGLTLWHVDYAD
jgi:tRNA pseudouridine38-40 synthase